MRHITRQMAASTINLLPSSFDAHMVEKRMLRLHTVAFANDILEYASTDDPLTRFSNQFARWLDATFQGQIHQTRKVASDNLGGAKTRNQEWEKANPQTPIT